MNVPMKIALQQCLKAHGIDTIYGVPGRESQFIRFNEVEGLDFISTRVEFTAAIAGEVHASLLNKPQAVFATMGPGATNLTTGIAAAMLNHAPVLYLTAQLEDYDKFYNYTHQCVDQTSIFEPITKKSVELDKPSSIYKTMHELLNLAMEEPRVPVHLAIPCNYFDMDVEEEECSTSVEEDLHTFNSPISDETLRALKDSIAEAKHPIAFLGSEICRENAYEDVLNLCHMINLPFFTAPSIKGISDDRYDSLNLGCASCYMEGIYGEALLQPLFADVDLVVLIGYQYVDDILPKMWTRGIPKKVVSIQLVRDNRLYKLLDTDTVYAGSIKQCCTELAEALVGVHKSVSASVSDYRKKISNFSEKLPQEGKLTPYSVIKEVNRYFSGGKIVTDIGYYRHHVSLFAQPLSPHSLITDTAISSFGSGLPSAIAAKRCFADKDVVLICGDGGFHSGSGDLSTLVKYHLPILIIVMNNSSFELIHLYQQSSMEEKNLPNTDATTLSYVDFVQLAEANGCEGKRVRSSSELRKAIEQWDKAHTLLIETNLEYMDEFNVSF